MAKSINNLYKVPGLVWMAKLLRLTERSAICADPDSEEITTISIEVWREKAQPIKAAYGGSGEIIWVGGDCYYNQLENPDDFEFDVIEDDEEDGMRVVKIKDIKFD